MNVPMVSRVYLKALALLLLVCLGVAIYRDCTDTNPLSVPRFVIRLVVFLSLAIGLYLRNVWAVRFAYIISIPTTLLLAVALYNVGSPLGPVLTTMMMSALVLMSITVFVPRNALLPDLRSPSVQKNAAHDPTNPYSPTSM